MRKVQKKARKRRWVLGTGYIYEVASGSGMRRLTGAGVSAKPNAYGGPVIQLPWNCIRAEKKYRLWLEEV